jgi:pimeloyl-ACP methyl ester carboxylesterase
MATLGTTAPKHTIWSSRAFGILKTIGVVCLLGLMVADFTLTILFYKRPLWTIDEAMHARLKLAGINSEYVMAGPYRVHYFVGGTGKPLLLIHGLGSRSEDWTPEMPDYVNNGFRVYAIDLLGCGRTDHPDIAYTIQQQADLIHGFLEAVHVQQADVIGWSMGGWVAFQFALKHPASVRRLVVMDSAGLSFQTSLTPEIFEPRTVPQLKRLEVLLVPRPYALPGFFDRALLRAMQRNFQVVHRTVESMIAGKDLLDSRLGQIHAPVLIVWGEQDGLIPPSVALRMHQEISQSQLEFYRGCGHIGPATCAGRIVPRVIDFLQNEPSVSDGTYHY